jgi:hypothetical protein
MGLRKKKSILDQAGDAVNGYVDQVKPQLEAAVAAAREKAGPVLTDVRDKAAPVVADAREKAGPAIAAGAAVAAEKIAAGASIAAEKAAEVAEVAAERVADVAEPAKGRKKKGGKFKKLLLLTGLAAAIAFVASRLRSGQESENWQSSYTPTPAPRSEDDGAGASPDEAIADQADEPRAATTPDNPAEVVDIDDKNA